MADTADLTRGQIVIAVGLLVVVTAVSWAGSFTAPLGDNHEGRVDARFSLQVHDLREKGLRGSSWGASMEPYAGVYAHHPPGANAVQAVVAEVAGEGDAQVRVFPYLAGLLALPAATWLLLRLGVRRTSAVAAVALLAGTPLFWCFGRLLWEVPLLFAVPVATLVATRRRPLVLAGAAAIILAAVTMSWIGGATAATYVVVAWFARRPDRDRPALLVLAGAGLIGATLSGAWILAATSTQNLVDQVDFRTTGGSFTVSDFIGRQASSTAELVPLWTLGLALAGLWIIRRRPGSARTTLVTSTILGILFVVAFPNGSYVHDYWIYPLLVPITIGAALAIDAAVDRWPDVLRPSRVAVAAVVLGVVFVGTMAAGGVGRTFFRDPEEAGQLARRTVPPTSQAIAWTANDVDDARWLSRYWDRPAQLLDGAHLAGADANDFVLVAEPLPAPFTDIPVVDRQGGYAIVRLGELRARCPIEPRACGGGVTAPRGADPR